MIGILNGIKWTLKEVLISISLKAKTGEKVKHLLAMCISSSDKCLLFIGPFIDWMIWYFWCLHFGIALSLALIFCMIRSWQRYFPFCRLPFHSVLLLCRSFISPCESIYNYSDCYAIVFFLESCYLRLELEVFCVRFPELSKFQVLY